VVGMAISTAGAMLEIGVLGKRTMKPLGYGESGCVSKMVSAE